MLPTREIPEPLLRQLLTAGTAIGANLEEAKSAYSRRELAAKYAISLKASRECLYWLRLFTADRPSIADMTEPLIDDCDQLIATLTTTVRKLKLVAVIQATAVLIVILLFVSHF